MNTSLYFEITSNLFVVGWLCLFCGNFIKANSTCRNRLLFIGGRLIPLGLFAAFLYHMVLTRDIEPQGNIFTYDGVIALFGVPERIINFWAELLALMLVVTRWMVDDGTTKGVNRYGLAVCLVGAFVSVAIGFVLYQLTVLGKGLAQRCLVQK